MFIVQNTINAVCLNDHATKSINPIIIKFKFFGFLLYFKKRNKAVISNKIDTTSDIYIHYRLPYHNKDIQDYTVMPVPIYELSTSRLRKFSSEIKYKGNKLRKDSDE